jgi:hypothetical protein
MIFVLKKLRIYNLLSLHSVSSAAQSRDLEAGRLVLLLSAYSTH